MINYKNKNGYFLIDVSPDEKDYQIEKGDLGRTETWYLFRGGYKPVPVQNVSKWLLHLLTKNHYDGFAEDFAEFIKQYAPDNKIDWDATFKYIKINNEFKELQPSAHITTEGYSVISFNDTDRIKSRERIIDMLIEKYQLVHD